MVSVLTRPVPWRRRQKEACMSLESILIWVIVGAIAGFLAGLIVKGYGLGLVGNIVVGIVGAIVAGWLLPTLGLTFSLGNPLVTSIAYATIGAVVLLLLIGLVRRAN
jgi:uncharacterized membrane protein YeaQ/YmgE (transglycosylase-associated protein family)